MAPIVVSGYDRNNLASSCGTLKTCTFIEADKYYLYICQFLCPLLCESLRYHKSLGCVFWQIIMVIPLEVSTYGKILGEHLDVLLLSFRCIMTQHLGRQLRWRCSSLSSWSCAFLPPLMTAELTTRDPQLYPLVSLLPWVTYLGCVSQQCLLTGIEYECEIQILKILNIMKLKKKIIPRAERQLHLIYAIFRFCVQNS